MHKITLASSIILITSLLASNLSIVHTTSYYIEFFPVMEIDKVVYDKGETAKITVSVLHKETKKLVEGAVVKLYIFDEPGYDETAIYQDVKRTEDGQAIFNYKIPIDTRTEIFRVQVIASPENVPVGAQDSAFFFTSEDARKFHINYRLEKQWPLYFAGEKFEPGTLLNVLLDVTDKNGNYIMGTTGTVETSFIINGEVIPYNSTFHAEQIGITIPIRIPYDTQNGTYSVKVTLTNGNYVPASIIIPITVEGNLQIPLEIERERSYPSGGLLDIVRYSDLYLYSQGATVPIRGIVYFNEEPIRRVPVPTALLKINVTDATQELVFSTETVTNVNGEFETILVLGEDAEIGGYLVSIEVSKDSNYISGNTNSVFHVARNETFVVRSFDKHFIVEAVNGGFELSNMVYDVLNGKLAFGVKSLHPWKPDQDLFFTDLLIFRVHKLFVDPQLPLEVKQDGEDIGSESLYDDGHLFVSVNLRQKESISHVEIKGLKFVNPSKIANMPEPRVLGQDTNSPLSVGKEMRIQSELVLGKFIPAYYMLQVKNNEGITVYLNTTDTILEPFNTLEPYKGGARSKVAISWIPEEAGEYILETFVWSDLTIPVPLSDSKFIAVEVNKNNQGG